MSVAVELEWRGGIQFLARDERDHEIVLDGSPEHGGEDAGFRPMALVLAALAGCSGVDVALILRKGRVPVERMRIAVQGERADAVPAVYERIHLHFHFDPGVPRAKAERAVRLSLERYCSVAAMLRAGGVEITASVDLDA